MFYSTSNGEDRLNSQQITRDVGSGAEPQPYNIHPLDRIEVSGCVLRLSRTGICVLADQVHGKIATAVGILCVYLPCIVELSPPINAGFLALDLFLGLLALSVGCN